MGRKITSLREIPLPLSLRFRREIHRLSRIESEDGELRFEEFAGKTGNLFLGDRSIALVKMRKEGGAFFFPLEGPAEAVDDLDELIAGTTVGMSVYKGSACLTPGQIRSLRRGSLIELDAQAEDPAVLFIPELGVQVGRGEVVLVGERLGLRVTEASLRSETGSRLRAGREEASPILEVRAILGNAFITLGELFSLEEGAIVELDSSSRDPVRVRIGEGPEIPARIEAGERGMMLRILTDVPAGTLFRRENESRGETESASSSNPEGMGREGGERSEISDLPSEVLSAFCKREPPEAGAFLLAQLGAEKGAPVLSELEEEKGAEILSALSSIDPMLALSSARHTLGEVLEEYTPAYAQLHPQTDRGFDSAEVCAELLNGLGEQRRNSMLSRLRGLSPNLTEQISKRLLRFEDILRLSDRDIQKVLREIDSQELAKAFSGVSNEVSEAFFRNMSSRAGKLLREEMEYMGAPPEGSPEEARAKVLEIIRILDEQGDIEVPKSGVT